MLAYFKREFMSFFKSPVGYIAFALFAFLSGVVFVSNFGTGEVNIGSEIVTLRSFFVIIVPVVTMGLFADDKKRGTDIIYYTSPVSLFSVVLGKFLAAFCLFAVMFVNILIHMIITKAFGGVINFGVLGAIVVYFVMTALFVALGILASAITDNQIVSAILSFVMILLVQILPTIGGFAASAINSFLSLVSSIPSTTMAKISENIVNAFSWLDPFKRTNDFMYGKFNLVSIIFCLSFAAFFLFLTYRILEKKRWTQS